MFDSVKTFTWLLGRLVGNKRNEKSPYGPRTRSEFALGLSNHALNSNDLEHYVYKEKKFH